MVVVEEEDPEREEEGHELCNDGTTPYHADASPSIYNTYISRCYRHTSEQGLLFSRPV